jgi:streptomycin 6-kinase
MLLERLEHGTPLSDHPDRDAALAAACGLVRRPRCRPLPGHYFRQAADVARHPASGTTARWTVAGEPFDRSVVNAAVFAARLLLSAPSTDEPVVVNQYLHLGNVLAAEREPWLVVDPKPLVGEPAFDGGHLLADVLAGVASSVDRVEAVTMVIAIWLGVPVERLWAYEVGEDEPDGRLSVARSRIALGMS